FLRSANIDLPAHQVSAQAEKFFFRGRDQLSEESARLAYRQGEEFRRRYVDTGVIDKRYLPREVRILSPRHDSHLSTALHFGTGLFGKKVDGTPVIPVVDTTEVRALLWSKYEGINADNLYQHR
ncbi:hypothetical protein PENTCL1PPCAC_17177, partial [Pristionchus entomophagus]